MRLSIRERHPLEGMIHIHPAWRHSGCFLPWHSREFTVNQVRGFTKPEGKGMPCKPATLDRNIAAQYVWYFLKGECFKQLSPNLIPSKHLPTTSLSVAIIDAIRFSKSHLSCATINQIDEHPHKSKYLFRYRTHWLV